MFKHVTLKALFFSPKCKLIIWYSGPKCKTNFYDRAEVVQCVEKILRCGDVKCPFCGGPLTIHGSYRRHFNDGNGMRHYGWIAQGSCNLCKIYPSIIPDFLMPYKHYETEVIEAAVMESEGKGSFEASNCPADDSTIRRWINQFKERGAQAVGWLLSILFTNYGRHVSAVELQSKGILQQLARLAREIQMAETGRIIGSINVILTKYHSGFI